MMLYTAGLAVAPAMASSRKVDMNISGNESPIHVTMSVEGLKIKAACENYFPCISNTLFRICSLDDIYSWRVVLNTTHNPH